MKWPNRNPIPFVYGGIVLLLLVGTIAVKSHRKSGSLNSLPTSGTTVSFSELSDQFQQILKAPEWIQRRSGAKTIWLKGNLKVLIPDTTSDSMIIVAYLLEDERGSRLADGITEWTLLSGRIDATAMNWLADECILSLPKSKERRIDGLMCNYAIVPEGDSFWCALTFRPTEASIPKLRSQVSSQPSEAIYMDVKKRVNSSMQRSGYFHSSSR